MFGGTHAAGATTAHAPVAGLQQPTGHGLGVQVYELTSTKGATHCIAGTSRQMPGRQQACAHGLLGVHVPPAGPQKICGHCACVVRTQLVVPGMQHGPTAGQGLIGPHRPDAGIHGAGQPEPITVVHAPLDVLQQKVIWTTTKQNTWLHVTPGLGEDPVGQDAPA
jgi:hypothetical protein